jgi:hypothetical protein
MTAKKSARIYLNGTRGERPLDQWRQEAAIPLRSYTLSSERIALGAPLTWTLEEEGRRVSQWRENDAPGLGAWLDAILPQLHGAWHLARTQLGIAAKAKQGAARSASERKTEARMSDAVLAKIAGQIIAKYGKMPVSELAAIMADRGHGSMSTLKKKLPKLLL